jgi:hypothetical protein
MTLSAFFDHLKSTVGGSFFSDDLLEWLGDCAGGYIVVRSSFIRRKIL